MVTLTFEKNQVFMILKGTKVFGVPRFGLSGVAVPWEKYNGPLAGVEYFVQDIQFVVQSATKKWVADNHPAADDYNHIWRGVEFTTTEAFSFSCDECIPWALSKTHAVNLRDNDVVLIKLDDPTWSGFLVSLKDLIDVSFPAH
jgi:hypothetical protein